MFKLIEIVIYSILLIISILLTVMLYMLWERKCIGMFQNRFGPNRVGPYGVLQPIADSLKLWLKLIIVPKKADRILFILSPIIVVGCAIASWAVVPLTEHLLLTNLNIGVLYLLAIQFVGKIGIIMSGWSSNSQYSLLGSLRSVAQIISYFIPMTLVIIGVIVRAKSMSLSLIVNAQEGGLSKWFCWPLFPLLVIYWICIMMANNRLPFDVAESESELVAGFHLEYSGMNFALLFLSEYCNIILSCMLMVIMFFGGWLSPFNKMFFGGWLSPFNKLFLWIPSFFWLIIKVFIFMTLFIWVRATLPRYKFDHIISLSWKYLYPLSLLWVIIQGILIN